MELALAWKRHRQRETKELAGCAVQYKKKPERKFKVFWQHMDWMRGEVWSRGVATEKVGFTELSVGVGW